MTTLEELTTGSPTFDAAYYDLAKAYVKANRIDKATDAIDKAIKEYDKVDYYEFKLKIYRDYTDQSEYADALQGLVNFLKATNGKRQEQVDYLGKLNSDKEFSFLSVYTRISDFLINHILENGTLSAMSQLIGNPDLKPEQKEKLKTTINDKLTSMEEVKIGDQIWMGRNLDVSTFRNGDPIPEAKTDEEWEEAGENGEPAWCYYNNNPDNGDRYGKLYNWYAVNDPRGLAPEGWKIPSDEDWSRLTDFLGGESVAGTKMKSTDFWADNDGESGNGTNESGFSGLPGGYRNYLGTFNNIGKYGSWWSSTEDNTSDAWSHNLLCNFGDVVRSNDDKEGGFYVRCLRD